MNNNKNSIDWLFDAYRQSLKIASIEPDCQALIETLKDPESINRLLSEQERIAQEDNVARRFGDLVVVESLAAGGMGEIYRARHEKLNRDQALKLLPADRMGNAAALTRFTREMQAIGRLQHPNIVTVHDAGILDGTPYISMELVEGKTFSEIVKDAAAENKELSIKFVCESIDAAAKGIEHAHKNNVLHRDIKPSNLMLARDHTVKVLDLGLAKFTSPQRSNPLDSEQDAASLTVDEQILGTPDFMAPEQISGDVDQRTDIYALAATAQFMLTGKHLFPDADTVAKKIVAVTNDQPPRPSTRRADIPKELDDLIIRSLSKNPADRPSTIAEFREALAEVLVPASNSDKPPAANQTERRSNPRRPIVLASVLLLATVIAALSVFLLKGPDGSTLRIECDDPTVEVVAQWIGEGSETIEPELLRAGESTKLRIGRWKLEVKGPHVEQAELSQSEVVLKSGQTEVVRVALLPAESPATPPNQALLEDNTSGQKSPDQNSSPIDNTSQIAAGNVVGVSPSGRYIVSKTEESDIHQIIELQTGTVLGSFDALSGVGCDWNAEETKLMVAGRQGPQAHPLTIVTIVDNDGKNRLEWSTRKGGHSPVEMSPTGDRILFGDGLHMTDLSGNVIESFQPPTETFRGMGLPTHMSPWAPDGSKFACFDEGAGEMLIYSPDGGKPLKRIKVVGSAYIRFVWLESGQGFSCLHDVYNLDGTKRPLTQVHEGDIRVFNPDETEWVTGVGSVGTRGVIGMQSGRIRKIDGFFENGFLFWNEPDVITSVDPNHPGRFREFSRFG